MIDAAPGGWTKERKPTMRTIGLILMGWSLLVCVAPATAQSFGQASRWHAAGQRFGEQRGVQRSRSALPRSVTWYSVFDGYSQAPQTGLPWKPDESTASIRSAARAERFAQRIRARNSRRSSVARRSRWSRGERYARGRGFRDPRFEPTTPPVRPLTPAVARERNRSHAPEIRKRPEPPTLHRINPEAHSVSPRPVRPRRSD